MGDRRKSDDGSNAAKEGRGSNKAISQDQIVKKRNESEDKFANVNSENEVRHEIFNADNGDESNDDRKKSDDGSNAAKEGRGSNNAISQDQIVKKKNKSRDKFANVNSEYEVGHEIFNADNGDESNDDRKVSHDGSNAAKEGRGSNKAISQDQIVKKKNDSEDKFPYVNSENEVRHEIFNADN